MRAPIILIVSVLSLLLNSVSAQKKTAAPRPSQIGDTIRVVEIKKTNTYYYRSIDSVTTLQILSGNVEIWQGRTKFFADSAVYNEKKNYLYAFGNVHIKDADSVNIYSQYLQYDGAKKIATFRNKVKLSDGNSTLFTEEMEYDMNGKVGNYKNGGRIESKQTTLISNQGYYYADIKDVYFIGDVKMSDPEIALATDSLLYNTGSQIATFIAPTTIKSAQSVIYTKDGFYDLKLKKAKFGGRTRMQDKTSVLDANDIAFDDKSGHGEAAGNVVYKDTTQGALLFSNRVFFNKAKKNFLATEKPVIVIVQNGDSVYVAADTIYSGLIKDLAKIRLGYLNAFDTLKQTKIIKVDSVNTFNNTLLPVKDSSGTNDFDSSFIQSKPNKTDSTNSFYSQNNNKTKAESNPKSNLVSKVPKAPKVSAKPLSKVSNNHFVQQTKSKTDSDTLRFITAFRNVRIFNDSIQAVADSLFFSGVDSTFKLFHNPIAWSKNSQISGDTIFIFTENKKPKRMYVFENGMLIQSVNEKAGYFNQIKGRVINGYFKEGNIDYVNAKGSAESIYYAQDDDSAFVAMNRTVADMIDMYFYEKGPKKVKYSSSVKGTTYPIRKVPNEQKKLENFNWLNSKRPKNKFELFQ